MKRLFLILAIVAGLVAFFAFDLDRYLTLETLKAYQGALEAQRQAHPFLFAGVYFLAYVVVTGLSLPGAAVMTLAGGAIFGLVQGVVLVSFASTIGATLAFLASRYVLRDAVQKRFGDRLGPINAGVEKDGPFYLFTLRLVPVFPFFLINMLMGLTPIRTWTFYWVSQVGMLPGTAVYVNAGTQLAKIDGLSGILSKELLLSFALVGVFPLIARWIARVVQRRRVYRGYRRPRSFDRNVVVIGAGAAGLVAAYIAAAVRAKVTLVEKHAMGGDCLNYGCVPSKALIRCARLVHEIRAGRRFGVEAGEPKVSFRRVLDHVRAAIEGVAPHDSVERYRGLGVDVVEGEARIVDPWTVEVRRGGEEPQRLTTRSIIVATGAAPFVPPLAGLDEVDMVTTDTLWTTLSELDEPPARLTVLGGGPIGCELAQALARLGSRVTLVEMMPRILLREDDEAAAIALEALEADGVEVLTSHRALRCERRPEGQVLVAQSEASGEDVVIPFDLLLCAVGRRARLTGFGLEELGVETGRTLQTNELLETNFPNIYAAGDVAGPYQFTHVAGHQAWYATVNALFGAFRRFKVRYDAIPRVTYLDPEIATVGLTEGEARERGIEVEVTRYDLDDLDRAITEGDDKGFVKVLTVPGKDRLVGATIVGRHGGEMLAELTLCLTHGLGLGKILSTIHPYPTYGEALKYVAGQWKRDHAPARLLDWVEAYHRWRRRGA